MESARHAEKTKKVEEVIFLGTALLHGLRNNR